MGLSWVDRRPPSIVSERPFCYKVPGAKFNVSSVSIVVIDAKY